jgi:N-acetylmuramoyl-L-alanine amidase
MPYWWITVALISFHSAQAFHLILDPAGDAKNPGRQLATCAERSVTLQFCEMLKEVLVKLMPSCTVTITRTAGEARTQEQRAQIANQLQADLFVHISSFSDAALRPQLALYYTAPSHTMATPLSPYTLIPAHKAQELVSAQSHDMVHFLYTALYRKISYTIHSPTAIPDARLLGIMIPACTLEFGITRDIPWTTLIEPLANALIDCIEDR